jgi:hypothetical protein
MHPAPKQVYLVHPLIDLICMGGLSMVLLAFLAMSDNQAYTSSMVTLSGVLVWAINWPHFSATSHRLYSVAENRRQYPLTTYLIPVLVLLGIFGSFMEPVLFAPLFVKIHLIWSSYHFSGQTAGLTLVYSSRAGILMKPWERLLFTVFIFGTFLTSAVGGERSTGQNYYGISLPGFGLPGWVHEAGMFILWGVGLGIIALYIGWALRARRLPPVILLVPAIAQYCWFIQGSGIQSFTTFVPLFHSLQYLLIAWFIYIKESADSRATEVSCRFVRWASFRWALVNFVGGMGLFYFLPMFFSKAFGQPIQFATGVTLAAVQIHHFFVDGVIWKLKNSHNRRPLMEPLINSTVRVAGASTAVA